MADIQLRPGEKFRLGRTSYEVLADADIEAALVEANGAKQDIRQVLYVCPKGCVCEATKKVWKCRYSRKQHACNPGKCPMCGEVLVEGQPEQKPQSVPPEQPQQNPNACEQAPPDQPQDGQPQQGEPQQGDGPPKDGTQGDIDDLKQALEQAKAEAKGKQPKPGKGKPKGGKGNPNPSKGKGSKPKQSPAEIVLEQAAQELLQKLQQDAVNKALDELEKELAEEQDNAAGDDAGKLPVQQVSKPEGLYPCFNCERPTNRPAGKGNLHLCDMCEDMRDHILDCLN